MDTAIQKAHTRLEQVTQDNEFMHRYTLRQMVLSDWTTGINTAFERGVEKGIEKGRNEGGIAKSLDIAKNALSKGLSMDIIQEITDLDEETIAALQNEQ